MPRRGAARGLNDWEQAHLGSYMDDYFGLREQDHAAEDAYEHAWLASNEFHKEVIDQALEERDRWKADYERVANELLGPYDDN